MSGAMMAFLVMMVAILFCQVCSYCDAVAPSSYLAFLPKARVMHNSARLFDLRGGDDDDDDMSEDEYDLDESSEEVEAEEPVVVALKKKAQKTSHRKKTQTSKLTESTKAATKKAATKKTAESKQAVSVTIASMSKKSKKSSSSMIRIPYILKACLNPLTVFAMTRAYFASLFNINYLEQDSSQTLRSALQEKAKQNDGATKKRKRAMKPGQAKTLSDLPQLSA